MCVCDRGKGGASFARLSRRFLLVFKVELVFFFSSSSDVITRGASRGVDANLIAVVSRRLHN